MSETPTIPEWHERFLRVALEWKRTHPEFTFSLRTGDVAGQNRLQRGYWFTGDEGTYLFFPPFRIHDQFNKTRSIGFVTIFDAQHQPKGAYLEVVFGGIKDPSLRPVHEEIIRELGGFEKKGGKDKYQRFYLNADPEAAFSRFLETDHPRMLAIVERSGRADAFLIPEEDFDAMLQRVQEIREVRTGAWPGSGGLSGRDQAENLILYGPPGTGKTFWLKKKLEEYTDSTEEVDRDEWMRKTVARYNWRQVIAASLARLGGTAQVPAMRAHEYIVAKGVERGRDHVSSQTVWGYLQQHTPPEVERVKASDRRPPFLFTRSEGSVWSLLEDWREQDSDAAELERILATGPADTPSNTIRRYRLVTFHPSYGYEDFIRGIRPVMDGESGITQFRLVDGVFKQICDEARANPRKRYALFIDEINRANISKVFGELITLIEPDKRAEYDANGRQVGGLSVQLPGGNGSDVAEEPFGVPANLDLYGTMNTADRSIALLDIALRRRFEFREIGPDYDVLGEPVGAVNLGRMLRRINDRLEYLLDRDHRIGHAYLMEAETIDDLQRVFSRQIIPLLQEYFFDDLARAALVLATAGGAPPFVRRERTARTALFPASADSGLSAERSRYVVTDPATWTAASFVALYTDAPAQAE